MIKISEKGNGWVILGVIMLVIACIVVVSLFMVSSSEKAVLSRIMGEYPYGGVIVQDKTMLPEQDQSWHKNGILVLYIGADGKCIPSNCKFGWIDVTDAEVLEKKCGDSVTGFSLGHRVFKPKDASAINGSLVVVDVFAISAVTSGGCLVGVPMFSDDFTLGESPVAPPENYLGFWDKATCRVAFYGEPSMPCSESGYYPEGNLIWQGPIPDESNSFAYVYKKGVKGIWAYPIDSAELTANDTEIYKAANPRAWTLMNVFYQLGNLDLTPAP